ncbi:MAG: substrate-binding domain-containing protein [Anaerolineae bacterium]|nr:substrate-binding domain-containing protein [Anaerolineae bacterium]
MKQTCRIGSQIGSYDPFWVQIREAVDQKAQEMGLKLIPIEIAERPDTLPVEDQIDMIEELLAQELDALICWNLTERMLHQILERELPVIFLSESKIRHPLFVSPYGLYEAGRMIGAFFAERLDGQGQVLCIGGLSEIGGEDGRTRIKGFCDALDSFTGISIRHIPSHWGYEQAYSSIEAALQQIRIPIDAIFGLSDPIALAARDVLRSLGRAEDSILIAGVNGDPLALAALADGSLSATVETSTLELGRQAVELAYQATRREPLPDHFGYRPRLVTTENLTEVALQKLLSIADLPSRLVGVNRQLEQNRLTQLEIGAAINRRVGALLDRHQLSREIADLIRDNFGYGHVQLYLWSQEDDAFILERGTWNQSRVEGIAIPLEKSGILAEALHRNAPILIPDTRYSYRFPPDLNWPDTLSRAVIPIRFGDAVIGLLDLHSQRSTLHLRQELIGLQSLADQLGIAIRNAELYAEAVQARTVAEKADRLKTRLLANVSHELRAPLNVIQGYSQAALSEPNPYQIELPGGLRQDIGYILQSCTHLTRLINDLLDLSRAEIDQLDLFPETIPTRAFLEDVFYNMADTSAGEVDWQLWLPDRLPIIQADPVRLRQILLNLLSNANKFTTGGRIVLGAAVEPPHLHLWVEDTGLGIPIELQERIFEPFVIVERSGHRNDSLGLGLSITRRLVALHGGIMSLESQTGEGSTFHVYLPLPSLSGKFIAPNREVWKPVLLHLSTGEEPSSTILKMAAQMRLPLRRISAPEQLNALLKENTPSVLAWDMQNAHQGDWDLVEHIRSYPQFGQLPFIVYREESGGEVEVTDVIMKPVAGNTLVEAIAALRPDRGAGPILIVDDDAEAHSLYQRLVNEALPGYPVLCAEDGALALESIREVTPSLVILDLMMPEVDGFTVLEEMRSKPATRGVPVLVMSGKLLSSDDIKRLDYSRVTFQKKEVLSDDEVIVALRKVLEPEEALPPATSILVKAVIGYFQQNYSLPVSRQEVAEAVGVSANYLSKIFRQEVGLSPWDFLNRLRILKARELLDASSEAVTEIAFQVGFNDPAYFSRVFRKYTGKSPQEYRAVGK